MPRPAARVPPATNAARPANGFSMPPNVTGAREQQRRRWGLPLGRRLPPQLVEQLLHHVLDLLEGRLDLVARLTERRAYLLLGLSELRADLLFGLFELGGDLLLGLFELGGDLLFDLF